MQKQLAIKLLIIFVLGAVILIPISMVQYKISERKAYLQEAQSAVAKSWTNEQVLMSPVLMLPYRLVTKTKDGYYHKDNEFIKDKYLVVSPDSVKTDVLIKNKVLYKGIYKVPVYNSDIKQSGLFLKKDIDQALAKLNELPDLDSLGEPFLSFYIADTRGIDETPKLMLDNKNYTLSPGSQLPSLPQGLSTNLDLADLRVQDLSYNISLTLRGSSSYSFIPLGRNENVKINSDWPHPEFFGISLPRDREVTESGFEASWFTTQYTSGGKNFLEACFDNKSYCYDRHSSAIGVSFIEPVDIYLQSERSIKYALLFVGLSFITFFIFEHIKQIKIHPIQYAFVGLTIAVFYLLLISLAEHIDFYLAYFIAMLCCSSLILSYVTYLLKKLSSAILFTVKIVMLYLLLYVIIQAEDYALLMGSALVFVLLAVLMMVTRKIDWYQLSVNPEAK